MIIDYTQLYTDVLKHWDYEGEPTWENVKSLFLDVVSEGKYRDMDLEEAEDFVRVPNHNRKFVICMNLMPKSYRAPQIESVKGTIEIHPRTGTISIRLDNGHYCKYVYPNGVKSFLETELEVLGKPKGWVIVNE